MELEPKKVYPKLKCYILVTILIENGHNLAMLDPINLINQYQMPFSLLCMFNSDKYVGQTGWL